MTKEEKERYKKAYVELNEVLGVLNQEQKSKIPINFSQNLLNNMNTSYKFQLDLKKSISEQNFMVETKALLVEMYEKYLAPEDEKRMWEKYDKICFFEVEKKRKEKYNYESLFEKKTVIKNDIQEKFTTENAIIEYKENFIKEIIKKIRNLLRRKF